MNWYLQNGKDSDIVLSSRIRFSRNINGIPFTTKASEGDLEKVYNVMKDASLTLGYGLKFMDFGSIDQMTKDALAERHIISKEFANEAGKYRAIILNDDENICIEVNGEDHIKIQLFCSGMDLSNLLNLAIEIDNKIENTVPYSYHKKYGYLTACPTNVGTGLKASVLVHLPGLSVTKNTRKVLNVVNNLGMSIRGLYGEGSKVQGDMYQISNNQTLGITEREILKNLNLITQKVIEQERVARKYLTKKTIELEDKLYRDYGILTNARKLREDETIELISSVKLGTDLGIIKELNDTKVSELILYTKTANLQKRLGKELSLYELQVERAKMVKQLINEN